MDRTEQRIIADELLLVSDLLKPKIDDLTRKRLSKRLTELALKLICSDESETSSNDILGTDIETRYGVKPKSTAELEDDVVILYRENKNLHQSLVGAGAGTWTWNIETNEEIFDEQCAINIGHNLADLEQSKQTWDDLVANREDLIESHGLLEECRIGTTDKYRCVLRLRHKDGSIVYVEDKGMVTKRDSDGFAIQMSGTSINITERIENEARLRQQAEILRAQVEASLDGILMIGSDDKRIFHNNRMVELFNVPAQILIDKNGSALLDYVASLTKCPKEFIERINHLRDHPYEISSDVVEFKDGTILDRYSTPVHGKEGEYYGRIWSYHDITERVQADERLAQIRHNYETFFDTIDDFLFVLDAEGNIIYNNQTVTDRLGFSSDELLGNSILMIHPPERRDEAGRIVAEMISGKADFCPVPIVTKSDIQIPVETRVYPGEWDGQPVLFGVTKDISDIMLLNEKFAKIFESNVSACGITDLKTGKYIELNQAFYDLLGFSTDEAIGKTAFDLGILTPDQVAEILKYADGEGKVINAEADLRAKNGDIKHVLLSAVNIYIQDKKYRFTFVNDVTELTRLQHVLKNQAEHDELTQLHNRNFLNTWVEKNKVGSQTSIIIADALGLKEINDTYGHEAGDVELVNISKALKQSIRPKTDFVVRIGGDEFAVILPDTSSEEAEIVKQRIKANLKKITEFNPYQIKLSMGIATTQEIVDKVVMKKLMELADTAMYKEKRRQKRHI